MNDLFNPLHTMWHCRTIDSLDEIDAAVWDRLNRGDYPFARHAFLAGLERTGCVRAETGWQPRHLLVYENAAADTPVGAVPLYLKSHSWGEYVFDWAWADAYERAGLPYYPKLLCAIPFTPATGPRLLVAPDGDRPEDVRRALVRGIIREAERLNVSSVHWLFTDAADTRALEAEGLLKRTGNQFHWQNRGYRDFDDFLANLTSKRRKQIRRERRQVAEAGVAVQMMEGRELAPHDWDAMYGFYRNTVLERGAIPYLSREFFHRLVTDMPGQTLIAAARDSSGELVAGALYLRSENTLYGRYWGASTFYEGLHFEACYYQPIDYCVRHGIDRFEAGAQGEHKLNRGLVPNPTFSAHWLAHPQFTDAVRDFLHTETRHVERYAAVLGHHSPFRREE
ncbi:MAG: GNAT family N-acetyltransferase [Gammaproteobacteria bacterium]|nr:GNAT family N-acetyltransferase [Gammaproteobacteria bacterium]